MTPQDVLAELTALQDGDLPTHGGATMAYVYDSGRTDIDTLAASAQAAFQWTNALDPTAFPSVARIENDLVGAALALLGGGPEAVGTLTSGGTESCLLAVLAAREVWRGKGGTGRARLLLPVTAGRVEALLTDLRAAAAAARRLPAPVPDPELVAAAATIDPTTLTVAQVEALLELAGVGGGRLPERMAPVHALVAALPRPVAERLLAGVLGQVYRPAQAVSS